MPRFVLPIKKRKQTRIDLGKCNGVTKYQLELLDDIKLLCKIGFLINCEMIDKCHSCRQLLKFCIKILLKRWDEIRFINFFDALKILTQYQELFNEYNFVQCWHKDRLVVKKMIKEFKNNINNNPPQIMIDKYDFLFEQSRKTKTFYVIQFFLLLLIILMN